MPQPNAKRLQAVFRATLTANKDDDRQEVDKTKFYEIGDVVEFIDVDANGKVLSSLGNRTINGIIPNIALLLTVTVDTTGPAGTIKVENRTLDDVQVALERLFCRKVTGPFEFVLTQDIVAQQLNTPSGGKTTYEVDDVSLWRAGDLVDVIADEGLQASDALIESVNILADDVNNRATVVITSLVDTSAVTSPFLLNKTITQTKAILRNQERLDEIDTPRKNRDLGVGNGLKTAFVAPELFVSGSSDLFVDGVKKYPGLAGTRASLTQDTGNAQLILTSLILGAKGDDVDIILQAGAGFTIVVTGTFNGGQTITINDNGGAATAQQLAEALNADPVANKILQAQWGGDGTGVTGTFTAASLGATVAGVDDGTLDYAEIEQVFKNLIVSTGFKIFALHIRSGEKNRLNSPPDDDEELFAGYSRAADNVDR